jgi:two-component system, LytTR family, sensor kinase
MRNLLRIRFALAGWALASLFFAAVLLVGDIDGHKPPLFALYANAVHFALWTLLLPILARCTRRFPLDGPRRIRNAAALLLIVAALAVPVMITQWAILFFTYFPYRSATFASFLQSESSRFLPVDILIGMVLVLALEGWRFWRDFQAERTRASELERQLAVARLDALRMQLHPHFLFNTLHTVAGLIVEQPPTARRMVIALGDLLRLTLRDTGDSVRSLAEELEFADLYLGIEKLRLGDRLVLDYDIEPEATTAEVPQLLLQPLFENAIRHGAARTLQSCEIRFRACREGDKLHILLRNDGPVRSPSLDTPPYGVGLRNTMDRLQLHYNNQYTFQYIDRPEGGVEIDLSIPYRKAGNEKQERIAPLPHPAQVSARRVSAADHPKIVAYKHSP